MKTNKQRGNEMRLDNLETCLLRLKYYLDNISEEEFMSDPMRRDAVYYCLLQFGKLVEELPSEIKSLLSNLPWAYVYILTLIEHCPEEDFWYSFMEGENADCNPLNNYKEWSDFIVRARNTVTIFKGNQKKGNQKKGKKKEKFGRTPYPNITMEDVIGLKIDDNVTLDYSTPRKHQSVWPVINRMKREN